MPIDWKGIERFRTYTSRNISSYVVEMFKKISQPHPHLHSSIYSQKLYTTTTQINDLSLGYDYVFDCRGPAMKKNYLLENIGGYKIKIKCFNPIDKCYLLESGWFIHSDETNKYNLIVRGGFILGSEKYDSFIKKENFKNSIEPLPQPLWYEAFYR